jgi:hypothetical protein
MVPASGSGLGLGSGLRDGSGPIEVVTLVLGVGSDGAGGSSAHPNVASATVNAPAQMRILRMLSTFRGDPAERPA